MASGDIGIRFAAEGDQTLKSAIQAIDNQLKALNEGIKASTEAMKGMSGQEDATAQKNEMLARSIEANKQKMELLSRQYDEAKSKLQTLAQEMEEAKKANMAANYKAEEIKPTIEFSDFEKLDIRVGHVKNCEKVKKANKLLKFTLDDGSGTDRIILSGIAKYYQPEELIGRDILFIANLAPRKLMGIESQGMILSAENFDGDLSVTTLMKEVKPGSLVK